MYLPPIITSILPFFLRSSYYNPSTSSLSSSSVSSIIDDIETFKSFQPTHAHATRSDDRQLLFHENLFRTPQSEKSPSILDPFLFETSFTHHPRNVLYDPASDEVISAEGVLSIAMDTAPPPLVIRTKKIPMLKPKFRREVRSLMPNGRYETRVIESDTVRNMMDWARLHRRREHELGLQLAVDPVTPLDKASSSQYGITYSQSSSSPLAHNSSHYRSESVDGIYVEWVEESTEVPDVTDRETLLTLAKMTSNAYFLPTSSDWFPLDDYNNTIPFGWEKDADGLRGHVFADDTNSTVIISIKGTSAGVLGSGGPTAKNDKFNDNLLFSCCCARVDFSWSPVCDCYAGGYKCEQSCLEKSLLEESVYTSVGPNLYTNVSAMYPNAQIWLVGHSLGGSLSSLIGLAFGAPVVTYEAPGERMAASRLHLPLPPSMPSEKMGVTHVYHNADPIPMGICTGTYSGCYAAGFAMESRCHAGMSIIYDAIGKLGWAVDIRTHRIWDVINKILDEDWEPAPNDTLHDTASEGDKRIFIRGRDAQSEIKASWWGWPGWGGGKGNETEPGGSPEAPEPEPEPEPKPTLTATQTLTTTTTSTSTRKPTPKPKKRNPNAVPKAESEDDCVDCFRWEFGNGMKKDPTTTTTSTSTTTTTTYTSTTTTELTTTSRPRPLPLPPFPPQ